MISIKFLILPDILETTQNPGNVPRTTTSNRRDPGDFEEIVRQHILQGNEDNEDNGTVGITPNWQNRKISELFDFSNSLWSTRYSNFASMSFDEELELYDLLELDAVGEEDPETADIDLDGTTQDILGV